MRVHQQRLLSAHHCQSEGPIVGVERSSSPPATDNSSREFRLVMADVRAASAFACSEQA